MQKFAQLAGMSGGPQPPRASREEDSASEMSARIGANMDYFFAHGLRPISFYMPDVSALGVFTRVAVGVGEDSVGQLAYRSAIALAEKLGSAPVVFPGGHGGYFDHPAAFAQALHRFFGGSGSRARTETERDSATSTRKPIQGSTGFILACGAA